MQIPSERAFWILDFYCQQGTPLHFGGRILGDEAACVAKVTHVWPEVLSITVRLFADDGGATWDRLIQIGKASSFHFDQLGDPSFARYAQTSWHSVLSVGFPDGTILFFAESAA